MTRTENCDTIMRSNMIGKVVVIIQMILSIWFLAQASFIPRVYLLVGSIVLFILFAVAFTMQFMKSKGKRITGCVVSVLISVFLVVGIFTIHKMNSFIDSIDSDGLKMDNMVIAVRKNDSAENIQDAINYKFAIQTSMDKENTKNMVANVEEILDKKLDVQKFKTVENLSHALIDKSVDTIIYNEAFTGVIQEFIPDYLDQVKIIYQYGIGTELENNDNSVSGESFNVYISGIDVSGPISKTSRSDVNIIMTVNTATKNILLTTTPRDYFVPIPEISGGVRDKLTHAGIYGVDASIRTLEELYGIGIDYYAKVNFSSLIDIVDILGGIEVYSKYEFTPLHGKDFHFVEGINHMNGEQALAFSRERYSFQEGDNQRGKNQEEVIEAIINKALTPAILKNVGKIIENVSDSIQTNLGDEQIKKLISMQLKDNVSWTIESQAVTGFGDKNSCYSSGRQMLYVMNPDMDSVREAKAKIEEVLGEEK